MATISGIVGVAALVGCTAATLGASIDGRAPAVTGTATPTWTYATPSPGSCFGWSSSDSPAYPTKMQAVQAEEAGKTGSLPSNWTPARPQAASPVPVPGTPTMSADGHTAVDGGWMYTLEAVPGGWRVSATRYCYPK